MNTREPERESEATELRITKAYGRKKTAGAREALYGWNDGNMRAAPALSEVPSEAPVDQPFLTLLALIGFLTSRSV
jgi:hypothetical protein